MNAIVIIGKQGSGKTTKAIEEAKLIGSYVTMGYRDIDSRFGLGIKLSKEPDVVIVEEAPLTIFNNPRIKGLVREESIYIEQKGKDPTVVKSPVWIFTCLLPNDFNVITV